MRRITRTVSVTVLSAGLVIGGSVPAFSTSDTPIPVITTNKLPALPKFADVQMIYKTTSAIERRAGGYWGREIDKAKKETEAERQVGRKGTEKTRTYDDGTVVRIYRGLDPKVDGGSDGEIATFTDGSRVQRSAVKSDGERDVKAVPKEYDGTKNFTSLTRYSTGAVAIALPDGLLRWATKVRPAATGLKARSGEWEYTDAGKAPRYSAPEWHPNTGDVFQRHWWKETFLEKTGKTYEQLTAQQRAQLDRGCVGVVSLLLGIENGNPESGRKVYAYYNPNPHHIFSDPSLNDRQRDQLTYKHNNKRGFEELKKRVKKYNKNHGTHHKIFAKFFFSGQGTHPDDELEPEFAAGKRYRDDKGNELEWPYSVSYKPNPKAFRPIVEKVNSATDIKKYFGQVDMHGDRAMHKYDRKGDVGFVNFDYGYYDEEKGVWWHANHAEYKDPKKPMMVYESNPDHFYGQYEGFDFDRVVFGTTAPV